MKMKLSGLCLVLITVLSVGFVACGPSEQDLDRAVQRYMEKQEQQKKMIAQVVQDELAKSGNRAPAQQPAPGADPSIEAQLANPAKVDVGNAPVKGNKSAPVTIVEFSDFQCPFCSRVNPTLDQLLKDYDGKVKIAYKNHPLPFHKDAKPAAIAAIAAQNQGKFWEMHDKLFANQTTLTPENFEKWAKELGLNIDRFKKDMQDPKVIARIEEEGKQGDSLGVSGTPTFFVNGVKLVGAKPVDGFKDVIDKVLKK